jgi:hypothetical protein
MCRSLCARRRPIGDGIDDVEADRPSCGRLPNIGRHEGENDAFAADRLGGCQVDRVERSQWVLENPIVCQREHLVSDRHQAPRGSVGPDTVEQALQRRLGQHSFRLPPPEGRARLLWTAIRPLPRRTSER